MVKTQKTSKKRAALKPFTDARVLAALKKSSDAAKRAAEALGLPFIAGQWKDGAE